MSIQSLFVKVERSIGSIVLDGFITERHEASMTITENPVEFGANISDHAFKNPRVLNIFAIVTDTPLSILESPDNIIDDVSGLFGSSTSENITRSTSSYNSMVSLMESGAKVSVQTGLTLYEDMMISGINVTRDKDTSRVVNMDITLQEVFITESELVSLPAENLEEGATRDKGSPNVDSGRKEPISPTDGEEKSILKSIKDWF